MKKWLDWDLEGKPWWKIVLRGAALPGMIVALIALCAAAMSAIKTSEPTYYLKAGIYFGLFATIFGGIGQMLTLIFLSKDIRTNGLLALGYGITWAVCLFLLYRVFT